MPNVGMVVTKVKRSEVAEMTAEESTTASWRSACAAMLELIDCSFVDMSGQGLHRLEPGWRGLYRCGRTDYYCPRYRMGTARGHGSWITDSASVRIATPSTVAHRAPDSFACLIMFLTRFVHRGIRDRHA